MGNFLDSDIGQCNRVDNVNEYQLNLHGNHAAGETEETLEKDDTVSILIHLRFSETDKGPLLYPCSFQLWGWEVGEGIEPLTKSLKKGGSLRGSQF